MKTNYLSYLWSELNGTLKFGTKVGVKSDFYFMTFFDPRPNNRFGRMLAFSGLIWLSRLFLVRIEWDLEIWNKSGGEKGFLFHDILIQGQIQIRSHAGFFGPNLAISTIIGQN